MTATRYLLCKHDDRLREMGVGEDTRPGIYLKSGVGDLAEMEEEAVLHPMI